MKKIKGIDILAFILASLPLVASLIFFNRLPEEIPMHWGISGEIDRYGSKLEGAFLLPAMTIGIAFLLYFVPKIDPKRANYEKFGAAYKSIIIALSLFMTVLHGVIIAVSLGKPIQVDTVVKTMVALMLIFFGSIMPSFKSNYFAGIRTPWTLANEEVWDKTHKAAGTAFITGGIVMLICSVIRGAASAAVYFSVIGLIIVFSFVYSYVAFVKVTK